MKLPVKLQNKIEQRIESNSLRKLYLNNNSIDFLSNDYLGFSKNKTILLKVEEDFKNYTNVNGSTGSRLLSGNFEFHQKLESKLAQFFNADSALLYNTGYTANVGLLSCVPQRGDIVLFDELCHASIRDGIQLSNAKSYSFKHNSLKDLLQKFTTTFKPNTTVYVVVESIYSMDGDMAYLQEIADFCCKKKCYLIVDEAHAVGVFGKNGKGLVSEIMLEERVFARIITFGKSFGCHGAAILGSSELINYLINFSRAFIYTTSMPLHGVLTIQYGIEELQKTKEIDQLRMNISYFKSVIKQLNLASYFIESNSAIQSCVIGNTNKVKEISAAIQQFNFNIKPILSPTVPIGTERIRFCIHSYNSIDEIKEILYKFSKFV